MQQRINPQKARWRQRAASYQDWIAQTYAGIQGKLRTSTSPSARKQVALPTRLQSWSHDLLQFLLWLGFAAFLLASLPHVAYFFASLEPQDGHGQVSEYWWLVAYALAISIDLTAFFLSFNVAYKMRRALQGKRWQEKLLPALGILLTHWPFILSLVAFSWLVNFEHAKQFQSTMLDIAEQTKISLLGWSTTLRELNPIIASAFPVLAVAYTGMADRLGSEREQIIQQDLDDTLPPQSPAQGEPADAVVQPVLEQVLQTFVTLNQQNLQAMQDMNHRLIQETVEQFSRVTIEMLGEAVNQHPGTNALPIPHPETPKIEEQANSIQGEQVFKVEQGPGASETPVHSKQRSVDIQKNYGDAVAQVVQDAPNLTVREVAERVGCSVGTANKWMNRLRPMTGEEA